MQMSDLAHKRRHISFTCGIKIRICIAEGGPITDMFIDSWKYRDNSFYVIRKKSKRISVIRSLVLNNRSASVRKTSIFSSTTDWTSMAMAHLSLNMYHTSIQKRTGCMLTTLLLHRRHMYWRIGSMSLANTGTWKVPIPRHMFDWSDWKDWYILKLARYYGPQCSKISRFSPITVFENQKKSLIQHCERSELRLHFEWTKVN